MEKRKLQNKLKGVCHLSEGNVGLSAAEQLQVQELVKDGMTPTMARDFVQKMRQSGPMPGELTIASGEIVTVIGRASWPETVNDPDPILVVYSPRGVVGLVKESQTLPV